MAAAGEAGVKDSHVGKKKKVTKSKWIRRQRCRDATTVSGFLLSVKADNTATFSSASNRQLTWCEELLGGVELLSLTQTLSNWFYLLFCQPPARYWQEPKDENKAGEKTEVAPQKKQRQKSKAKKRKRQDAPRDGKRFISGVRCS